LVKKLTCINPRDLFTSLELFLHDLYDKRSSLTKPTLYVELLIVKPWVLYAVGTQVRCIWKFSDSYKKRKSGSNQQ